MGYEHHIVLLLLAMQIGSTHNQIRDKVASYFQALQLKQFGELVKYQEQVSRVGNSEIQFIFNEKLLQNLFFCKQHVQQDQIQPFMVNIESETYQFLLLYQGKSMEICDLSRVELMIQLQTQINSNSYQLSDSNCIKVLKFINSEDNQQVKLQQMQNFTENLNKITVSFESLCKISNFQALPAIRSLIMQLINQKLHIFQSFKVLFLYFVSLILTKQQQQFLNSFNDLIEVGALRFQQFMLLPLFRCFEYLMEPEESDIQGFLYPSFILPDLYQNVTVNDAGSVYREKLRKLEAEFKMIDDGDVYDLITKEFQSNSTSVYKFPLVYYQFYQYVFQTRVSITKKLVVTTLKQFRNFYQNCYFEKQDRKLQFIPHFKYIQLIERFDLTIQNILDTSLINQVFPNFKIEFADQFNLQLFTDLLDSPIQQLPTIIQHDQKFKGIEDFSILELLKMGLHYDRQQLIKVTEYGQFSFYDLQINDFMQSNSQHLPFVILGECLLKFDQRKLQQYFQSISIDIRIYQLYEYFQNGVILPEYLSFGNDLQLQLQQSKQKFEIKQISQTSVIDQFISGGIAVSEHNADDLVKDLLTYLMQEQNQFVTKQDEIKLCLKNLKQFANNMKQTNLLRLKMCYIFNCKSLNCDDPLDITMLVYVINVCSPKHPYYSALLQVFDQFIQNDIQNLMLIMSFVTLFKIPNKFLFNYVMLLLKDQQQLIKLQNQENILLKYLVNYITISVHQQQQSQFEVIEEILTLLLLTYHGSITYNQKQTIYSVLQNKIVFEKMQLVAELLSTDKEYCNLCFNILMNQYDLNNLFTLDTQQQQEIIQFCCGLHLNKIKDIPISIITYSIQSQPYSDELLDFAIQKQLVNHLPKFICKLKIPFLVVEELFNNDLNFRFQKSIQQTTDNNDFRLALMGIHQVNPNNAISWRLNKKDAYVISNIFDDFMCKQTETSFTLLLSMLLRNIQKKEFFSMTMCMLLAALFIRDSSNYIKLQDIVIALKQYLPYFEYELIDSAINVINKQDTCLQRLQNHQQVSALEEEMLGQMDTIIIFSEYQLKQYDKQDIKSIHNNQSEVVRMLPNEYMDQDTKINKLKIQFQQVVTQQSYRLKDIFVKLLTIVDNNFIFGDVLDQKILIDFQQNCYILLKNIVLYLLLTLNNALVIEKFIKMQFINQIILHYSTDKEFLTILNYISAHNGTISCATIERPLQQQLFNQQFYLQTLMEMMKAQQTFPIVAEVVLQHPIHDVKISQVTIQNVAQSANLVIFVQLSTNRGTICEVVKIGHENFSQSYAFELLTDVMNENLQYELGPASGSIIRKLHSVPFMTLSIKDRDQLNLTRSVQEVITRYQKQLPKEIEVGISPFERLTPLISVFDQFKEFKEVMPQLKQLYQNQHNKQLYQEQQKTLIDQFPKDLLYLFVEKQRIIYKDISYRRFLESFIVNSIITLIFGYGDRHLDNIVISDEQLMNIDPEKLYFFSLLQGTPEVVRFRYTGNFQRIFPPDYFQHSVNRIQQQLFSNNRSVIEFILKNQVQNDILRHFILMKLDLTEAQWAREVQDATDPILLCKMFCGWMPFV